MGHSDEIESAVSEWIRQRFGKSGKLNTVNRLSGGASQETWRVIVERENNETVYILRRRPFVREDSSDSRAIPLATEAALIKLAAEQDVPVPEVIDVFAPDSNIGEAFIMGFVDGQTIARKILRDEKYAAARQRLPDQCGAALANIHSTNNETAPELAVSYGGDQLREYVDIYRAFEKERPVFELAIRWLEARLPTKIAPVLVHGDYRLGNIIINEDGLAAVIDWELAHIGDPREDIGWMCVNSWRFGQRHNRLGGFGALEPFLESYARAGGQSFSVEDIDWWQALGSFKWGIMCMIMYDAFQSGADTGIERAMIGRRVSETELDLLNIIEGKKNA